MTTDSALITAESHMAAYDYAGNRPALLLYFRGLLDAAGKTSPKANAVRQWINDIVFAAALTPNQVAAALVPPPHAFHEVATEAAFVLSQP